MTQFDTMNEFMALSCYETWYKKDVSPNLNYEQKKALAEKISKLSQREPIFLAGKEYDKKDFKELEPFSHTKKFSGMQLYATLTEIMKEFGANVSSASQVALTKNHKLTPKQKENWKKLGEV